MRTTIQKLEKEARLPNSTYPKVAVQWLNQALCAIKGCAWLTVKCSEIATFGYLQNVTTYAEEQV